MTKVHELSFREMYHRIAFIEAPSNTLDSLMAGCPRHPQENGVLVYGYIDTQAGFTFEILCSGSLIGEELDLSPGMPNSMLKLRRGVVQDSTITIPDDIDVAAYRDKIDLVNEGYKGSEALSVVRDLRFLDDCRHPEYPDDVLVHFAAQDKETEGCWVRSTELLSDRLRGVLLNEPYQDFGVHSGEVVEFALAKQGEKFICFAFLSFE